ncbi:MAG: D-alanyl-D-alanine carboxypeptidase family protein [Aestuariivirga sp.]|nr:D-alanyl-D-alanine carboxypeptidase [Hyphomicrobiales bacterium]HQX85152.1 D-alanyl-D-alanine carboxypeptidase family protein [Aestuariivirga sp.]
MNGIRIVLRTVVLLLLLAASGAAFAQDVLPFETTAPNAILIDAKSGTVFFEKKADELVQPASMSKLMTMVMVFEALKAGTVTLDTEFPISVNAWKRGGTASGGSTMFANVNTKVKLIDLMHGAMIQSANDACIAIAEGMAGSEEEFAARMTLRAKELGLQDAVFRNVTGLPRPENRASVRDLTILARYVVSEFPEYYKIYGKPEFTWNKITQKNRNPLLLDYPGADGMKTGYIREAGYGLVGSAMRDGRRLILVVAGVSSIAERKEEAQKLLDWGFRQFKTIDVYAAGDVVSKARVWGGTNRWVDLVIRKDLRLALSAREQESIEVKLSYAGPLIAPVKAGAPIGTVKFMMEGKAIAEVQVETANDVAAVDSIWSRAMDSLLILALGG